MLKQILQKIQNLEQKKKAKVDKQLELQKGIDELDINLKKLYSLKKDYEKLEKNSKEFLDNIKGKTA